MKSLILLSICAALFTMTAHSQVLKTSRTDVAISHDDNNEVSAKITQSALPPLTAVSALKFSGLSMVNKVGRNLDVDTATVPEDIWETGGVYPGFPDTLGETIQCFSASASDTAAGTGARTITLVGLDADYAVQSESFTLNGTTPVTGTKIFVRAHTARVTSAGSGAVNAGIITCRHSTTTANVFLTIPLGFNQSNCSAYTIPAGYVGYIVKMHGQVRGGSTGAVDGSLWVRNFGEVFRGRRPFVISNASDYVMEIPGALTLPQKSDVIVRASLATSNNLEVVFGYDLLLIKNGIIP